MVCNNDDAERLPRSLVFIEKNDYGEITNIVQMPKEDLNIFSRAAKFGKRLIKYFLDCLTDAALFFKKIIRFCVNMF